LRDRLGLGAGIVEVIADGATTRSNAPDVLVDTSVAVAMVVADHEHHATTLDAIGDRRTGLAGHADVLGADAAPVPSPANAGGRRPPHGGELSSELLPVG
jgi:hypothetical protein